MRKFAFATQIKICTKACDKFIEVLFPNKDMYNPWLLSGNFVSKPDISNPTIKASLAGNST